MIDRTLLIIASVTIDNALTYGPDCRRAEDAVRAYVDLAIEDLRRAA